VTRLRRALAAVCDTCGIKITSGTRCPECKRLLEDLKDK
jgi:hypothetical protein